MGTVRHTDSIGRLCIALAHRWEPRRLFVIFTLGTVLMRSAGCAINDYADRKLDPQVARTAGRLHYVCVSCSAPRLSGQIPRFAIASLTKRKNSRPASVHSLSRDFSSACRVLRPLR